MYHYLNTFENEGICEDLMDCHRGLYHFFCDYSDLSFWKNDLSAIFEQVLLEKPNFRILSPKAMLNQGGEFLQLIYYGFFLCQKTHFPACPNPEWKDLILKRTRKQASSLLDRISHLPQYLKAEEIQDPYLFLKDFFYRKPCPEWARRWNQLIEEAFSDYTSLETEDIQVYQSEFKDFNKLLEANYLLFVRHFKPKKPDDFDLLSMNYPIMF